jgi:HK97 family phage prohead protease
MARLQKVHPAVITSVKGNKVRALVSTWDVVDFQGDRVRRGAFTKSIREWQESGDKLPYLWSHQWVDPFAHLGVVNSMRETDRGLEVDAEILDNNEFAQQVKRLLAERRVVQHSFAYDVVREHMMEDGSNELLELKLIECGPCLSGANPNTDLLSRKSVQQMLAREEGLTPDTLSRHGRSLGWAGTTIPKKAVDELRSKVSGVVESFLDDLYHYHAVPDATPKSSGSAITWTWVINPKRKTDDDLRRQLDELSPSPKATPEPRGHWTHDVPQRWVPAPKQSAGGNIMPETAAVLMEAASRLAQSAVRATAAGLPDAEAALMAAAAELRTIASGGQGDVASVIESVRPLVAQLRSTGQTVAASNLERTIIELEGGTRDTSPQVVGDRDRYEPGPKNRDADLLRQLDALDGGDHAYDAAREHERLRRIGEEDARRLPR